MTNYAHLRASTPAQRLRFLLNDSVLYGGASAVSKLIALFTVPVLARVFSAGQFGAMDALTVWTSLLIMLATMGQDSAVARFFYDTDEEERQRQVVSQALLITVVLSLLIGVMFLVTAPMMVRATLADRQFVDAARVAAISIPLTVLVQFFRNLLKWTFSRMQFLVVSLGSSATAVGLAIFFVVRLHTGVIGVFWAQVIAQGCFAFVGAILCRRWIVWPAAAGICAPLLHFGWPYMLIGVLSSAIPALDRLLISRFIGLEGLGQYAVGYKLGSVVLFATFAFQTAWGPFSLAIFREDDAAETYSQALSYYVAAVSMIVFVLALAAEPLIKLFASDKYVGGAAVVLPIAFGLFVESIGWILGIGIDLSKKTYGSAISYCIGVAIAAFTMLLLIPRIGIMGAAYGMMIGRTAQAIAYAAFGHRVYPLRVRWQRPTATATSCLLLAFAARAFSTGVLLLPARAVAVACYAFLVWFVGLSALERSHVVAVLRPSDRRLHSTV